MPSVRVVIELILLELLRSLVSQGLMRSNLLVRLVPSQESIELPAKVGG